MWRPTVPQRENETFAAWCDRVRADFRRALAESDEIIQALKVFGPIDERNADNDCSTTRH